MNELLNKAALWFDSLGVVTMTRNDRLYIQKASLETIADLAPQGSGIMLFILKELRTYAGTNKYYWAEIGEEWLMLDTM